MKRLYVEPIMELHTIGQVMLNTESEGILPEGGANSSKFNEDENDDLDMQKGNLWSD